MQEQAVKYFGVGFSHRRIDDTRIEFQAFTSDKQHNTIEDANIWVLVNKADMERKGWTVEVIKVCQIDAEGVITTCQ
jgi:hypothetical protein